MSKRGIIQLSEFDINQKIIESLSNVCTRSVLFSVKDESKDVTQIANELKISLSTVYKTLSTLEDLALAEVDRYVISPEGKKIKLYRSRIGKVEITLENMEPTLLLHPNDSNSEVSN
ncbi:MAG: ArsR family transcriptional regulator [Candidatus Nitrosopumilus sp. metabat.KBP569_Feb_25m_nospike.7]